MDIVAAAALIVSAISVGSQLFMRWRDTTKSELRDLREATEKREQAIEDRTSEIKRDFESALKEAKEAMERQLRESCQTQQDKTDTLKEALKDDVSRMGARAEGQDERLRAVEKRQAAVVAQLEALKSSVLISLGSLQEDVREISRTQRGG